MILTKKYYRIIPGGGKTLFAPGLRPEREAGSARLAVDLTYAILLFRRRNICVCLRMHLCSWLYEDGFKNNVGSFSVCVLVRASIATLPELYKDIFTLTVVDGGVTCDYLHKKINVIPFDPRFIFATSFILTTVLNWGFLLMNSSTGFNAKYKNI